MPEPDMQLGLLLGQLKQGQDDLRSAFTHLQEGVNRDVNNMGNNIRNQLHAHERNEQAIFENYDERIRKLETGSAVGEERHITIMDKIREISKLVLAVLMGAALSWFAGKGGDP